MIIDITLQGYQPMKRLLAIFFALVIVGVVGAAVVLGSITLPAPTQHMEVPVSNDRLAQ
ncbi:MAG: hypothetical protein ACREFM_06530 [Hypericibacter sp.]